MTAVSRKTVARPMDSSTAQSSELPSRFLRASSWWAAAVFALAAAATLAAGYIVRTSAHNEAAAQFAAEADRVVLHVTNRLVAYEAVLRSGVAMFDTFRTVSRSQWHSFVGSLKIKDNYPGIQGIGFAEIVPADQKDAQIARVRAEGFPDYTIRPEGTRPLYSAIIYLEPFDWRNQRAFGFDMLSEPVRRAAMERARDTGDVVVSGKVTLVQETETDQQTGFLMYLPVYREGVVPDSVERRRQDLIGFVYSPFRARDLMQSVVGEELRGLRLQVFDSAAAAPEAALFDSNPAGGQNADAMFAQMRPLPLPGGEWSLRFSTLPDFAARLESAKSTLVLVGGLIGSLALASIAWLLARGRERLREKEGEFRFLFEKNPRAMWVYDTDSLAFIEVNEAAIAQYGYSREEFKRMRITDIRPPEDVARLRKLVRGLGPGVRHSGEWRHVAKDGRQMVVEVTGHGLTFAGRPASLVVATDVSERRRAEDALRATEAQKGAVIALALDAVIVIDGRGCVLDFNPAAERMFGYRRADVLGREMAELIIPAAQRDRHRQGIRHYLATGEQVVFGQRLELTALRADGSEFPAEIAIDAIDLDGRPIFTGFVRDITERLRGEQALREGEARLRASEERYRHVVDLIREAVWIHVDGTIIFANPAAASLFGADETEALIGRSIFSLIHPDDRPRALERTRIAVGERIGIPNAEMRLLGLDGRIRIAELHAVPFLQDGALHIMSAGHDVTAQREAEARLQQAQKMEAIGQLTGGVAHDFNNLLTVVIGNLDSAVRQASSDTRRPMEAALEAAERGAALVQRLLAFSRRQTLVPEAVRLNQLVAGMGDLLRRSLGEDIEIETKLAPELWAALADKGQVENALLNLAVNARDAMPDGGKLTIETSNVQTDEAYAVRNPEAVPGEYVLLAVTDTGSGMSPEVIEHAFEPFFTTKEVGKGSGLGLSMVYGFAKQSRGHVKIYSEIGHGTTVRLYLPRLTSGTAQAPAKAVAEASEHPRGGETILVVEDDANVRVLVLAQLQGLGYRVLAAADGREALDILGNGAAVDLLFTDVVMPGGMTGRQLGEAARRAYPHLRILFTSGYTQDSITHQGKLDQGVHFLSKPYRLQMLAKKIREALEAPS